MFKGEFDIALILCFVIKFILRKVPITAYEIITIFIGILALLMFFGSKRAKQSAAMHYLPNLPFVRIPAWTLKNSLIENHTVK